MNTERVTQVPIAEIRILNPRSRNKITFHGITNNIAKVGLKKPITVHQRAPADDGTRYDLICGQGRLEALRSLGETMIPAIINNAPEPERYLMSLVENLARLQPRNTGLLLELKRLRGLHYKPATIADKLGLEKSYVNGAINLLRHGEEQLIACVEAGRLPIDTAIKIATGTDAEVQRALNDAYQQGTLRFAKLRAAQQLITRRKMRQGTDKTKRPLTGDDLVRTYERHTQQQRALIRRSSVIAQRLAVLTASLRRLLADDHFLTLLRAEGLRTMPEYLATRVAKQ
jgi:ParB family chromosome partitioning protein